MNLIEDKYLSEVPIGIRLLDIFEIARIENSKHDLLSETVNIPSLQTPASLRQNYYKAITRLHE